MNKQTFGQFIHEKRIEQRMTFSKYSEVSGVAIGHLSDIEHGNRPAPESGELLDRMITALKLTPEEEIIAYDLAAQDRNAAIPEDLSGYIKGEERATVIRALRTARDAGAGVAEWEEFIRQMEAKRNGRT